MSSDNLNPSPTTGRILRLGCAAIAGAVTAIVCVLIGYRLFGPEPIPALTAESLAAAKRRWEEHGAADYDIEVQLSGSHSGNYHVEVRDQVVRRATMNGRELSVSRTRGAWSVLGMFRTVEMDLDLQTRARRGERLRRLFLRANFAEDNGIPLRYVRAESGGSAPYELTWQVTSFVDRTGNSASETRGAK